MENVTTQVSRNANDIEWMKKHMRDLQQSMKRQNAILVSILLTLIGGIITLIKIAPVG